MIFRRLPDTDIEVSVLSLGTLQVGWTTDEKNAIEVLDSFVDVGGNLIDTADNYSQWAEGNLGGIAESILGRWISERGNRSKIVIATKVGKQVWDGENGGGLGKAHIVKACERSLKRLQTDYIDLYQCHLDDIETPLEETLTALDKLVRAGKIRFVGCSNYSPERLSKALIISDKLEISRFISSQTLYNILRRSEVEGLRSILKKEKMGLLCYNTLAAGFLTGKYSRAGRLPCSSRLRQVQRRYCTQEDYAVLDKLKVAASHWGLTAAQLALAWVISDSDVTSAIVGVNSTQQFQDCARDSIVQMTESQRQELL